MIEQKITIGVMLSFSPVKLHYHVILMKETQNGPFIHFSHKNLVEIMNFDLLFNIIVENKYLV